MVGFRTPQETQVRKNIPFIYVNEVEKFDQLIANNKYLEAINILNENLLKNPQLWGNIALETAISLAEHGDFINADLFADVVRINAPQLPEFNEKFKQIEELELTYLRNFSNIETMELRINQMSNMIATDLNFLDESYSTVVEGGVSSTVIKRLKNLEKKMQEDFINIVENDLLTLNQKEEKIIELMDKYVEDITNILEDEYKYVQSAARHARTSKVPEEIKGDLKSAGIGALRNSWKIVPPLYIAPYFSGYLYLTFKLLGIDPDKEILSQIQEIAGGFAGTGGESRQKVRETIGGTVAWTIGYWSLVYYLKHKEILTTPMIRQAMRTGVKKGAVALKSNLAPIAAGIAIGGLLHVNLRYGAARKEGKTDAQSFRQTIDTFSDLLERDQQAARDRTRQETMERSRREQEPKEEEKIPRGGVRGISPPSF